MRAIFLTLFLFGIEPRNSVAEDFSGVFHTLETRCFECHGPARAEKDLRLDEERYARRIGHLGTAILGTSRDSSELFLRVNSEKEDFRMPPEGEPLTPDEIEAFGKWLDKGAPWNYEKKTLFKTRVHTWLLRIWEKIRLSGFWIYLIAATVFLAAGHWVWKRRGSSENRGFLPKLSLAHFAVIALIFAVFATRRIYTQKIVENHELWMQQTRTFLEKHTNSDQFVSGENPTAARPSHPKRMGGTYYRGNDERDPRLFNNGFYRTATMELALKSAQGKRLDWGEPLSENCVIELEIKRAPAASPSLFTRRIMDRVFLSTQWLPRSESFLLKESPTVLTELEQDSQWKVSFPINPEAGKKTEGAIYVYLADEGSSIKASEPIEAEVSYGIHYEIFLDEAGKIQRNSELWMGSLTTFAYIAYPPEGSIPLPEWFDWRPIPLVVGEIPDAPDLINGATP